MKRVFIIVFAFAFIAMAKDGDLHAMKNSSGTDWDFYGSARMSGFYWDRALWYTDKAPIYDTMGNQTGTKYQQDPVGIKRMIWDQEYMSRFGALVKKGDFGFRFEAGWGPVTRDVNISISNFGGTPEADVALRFKDGLILRRLYGEWFINDYLSLLVGQEWSIANFFPSSQVFDMEDGLCYSGALFTGRKPQIRLTFEDKSNKAFNYNAEIAVVKPDTFIVATEGLPSYYTNAEEKIPKIEGGIGFDLNMGNLIGLKGQAVAGVNRYDLITNLGYVQDANKIHRYLVKANLAGFDLDLTLSPKLDFVGGITPKFRFSFAYAQGTNLGAYGVAMGNPWGSRADQTIQIFYPYWGTTDSDPTGKLRDAFTRQGCAVFNFKPFDFMALETGAGKIINRNDAKEMTHGYTNEMVRWAWYVNMQFYLLDGHVTFIPEYSFSDLGGGPLWGTEAGKWKAYGLLMQLDM